MSRGAVIFLIFLSLVACVGAALNDHPFVLDTKSQMLRAHDPKDDRRLSDCDPETLPSGEVKFPCVTHFVASYIDLLNKISQLEADLKQCQASHP